MPTGNTILGTSFAYSPCGNGIISSRSIATQYSVGGAINTATPVEAIADWVNGNSPDSPDMPEFGQTVLGNGGWNGTTFNTVTTLNKSLWYSVMCNGTFLGDTSYDYVRTEIFIQFAGGYSGFMCLGSEWVNGVRGGPCTVGCYFNTCSVNIELPCIFQEYSNAIVFGLIGSGQYGTAPNSAPDLTTWMTNAYHGYPINGFVLSTTPLAGWSNPPGWSWNPSQTCSPPPLDPFNGDP